MKQKLTIRRLIKEARSFCEVNSGRYRNELFGVTDGKAIGTFVEHEFKQFLQNNYDVDTGNSALGLDLPSVETDIKVTSITQPQSSCPFKDSKQKIFGLGYNLLVFVYNKTDNIETKQGALHFVSCSYIDKSRTADFQTTTGIRKILDNDGNCDDIFAFLAERHIPADDTSLYKLAEYILQNPPEIGYLTISNALQWRLQYGRIVALEENVQGIHNIIRYKK
ncbi:MAG: restriction endonuclease [Muribaculum sp.]|nr:restriction endonuclease [Muribaculum sp.]